ncbi:MAG: right-handed parallel beta-helix repeat-containing protein [Planctomycetota bacterium]
MKRPAFLLFVAASLAPATATAQSTWFVDASGTVPGSGTSSDPYVDLQYAIDQTTTLPGDTLVIAAGVYSGGFDLGGKALRLIGAPDPGSTILDGQGVERVVTIASNDGPGVVLQRLTLQNGYAAAPFGGLGEGGGLLLDGVDATVRNCVIRDCEAERGTGEGRGGGIYAIDATLLLQDSVVESCPDGGGIFASTSSVTIDTCVVTNNRRTETFSGGASGINLIDCAASIGFTLVTSNGSLGQLHSGGIFVRGGVLDMLGCSLVNNVTEFRGGALFARDAVVTVRWSLFRGNRSFDEYEGGAIYFDFAASNDIRVSDSTFIENRSGDGGAVYVANGEVTIERCEFLQNIALSKPGPPEEGKGGAIRLGSPTNATIRDSIFVGNRAQGTPDSFPGEGGAVFGPARMEKCTLVNNFASGGVLTGDGGGAVGATLDCCIVWDNSPNACGAGTTATTSCVEGGWPGTGNFDEDPLLWSIFDRDLHLLPGSPCIDACATGDIGAIPFDPFHCGVGCDGPLGSSPCASSANSTGNAATLSALGSATAADDLLIVVGEHLPPGAVGFMLGSMTPDSVPGFGGSQGVLCVGGSILRFSNDTLVADPSGVIAYRVDLSSLPNGSPAMASDTWIFQSWFRDQVNGAPTSNTTSAVRIQFL